MARKNRPKTFVAPLGRVHALVQVSNFRLQPADKKLLLEILDRPATKKTTRDFIAAAQQSIGKYIEQNKFEMERRTVAESIKSLKRLNAVINKLSSALQDLPHKHWDAYVRLDLVIQHTFCLLPPGYTRPTPPPWNQNWHIVSINPPSRTVLDFLELLQRDLQSLRDAAQLAQEIGKNDTGGRPVKVAQIVLGNELKLAFQEHLREEPMTTINGKFERAYRLCFKAAGEFAGASRDLHALVMRVLKSTKPPPKKRRKQT